MTLLPIRWPLPREWWKVGPVDAARVQRDAVTLRLEEPGVWEKFTFITADDDAGLLAVLINSTARGVFVDSLLAARLPMVMLRVVEGVRFPAPLVPGMETEVGFVVECRKPLTVIAIGQTAAGRHRTLAQNLNPPEPSDAGPWGFSVVFAVDRTPAPPAAASL